MFLPSINIGRLPRLCSRHFNVTRDRSSPRAVVRCTSVPADVGTPPLPAAARAASSCGKKAQPARDGRAERQYGGVSGLRF